MNTESVLSRLSDIKISQSIIKDLWAYKNENLCGLVFKNKWVLGQFGYPSKEQLLGQYFEYCATGAIPKNGVIPEPVKYKSGKNKGKSTKDFEIAEIQADYFNEIFVKYGLQIIDVGKDLKFEKFVGTYDIKAVWHDLFKDGNHDDSNNPEHIVYIDLKFSGLLEDKYNPLGWHLSSIANKEGTKLQCKHYKWLNYKIHGFNPPFLFFVFDSKKPRVVKIIEMIVSDESLEHHGQFLIDADNYLKYLIETNGFKPLPAYQRCVSCKYKNFCIFKKETPEIHSIHIH